MWAYTDRGPRLRSVCPTHPVLRQGHENKWAIRREACHPSTMTQTMYVFLWAHPGMEQALSDYEDAVLRLVTEHGGSVVHRAWTDGAEGRPLEIQLFEWASAAAMDRYMADPRRTALSDDRERAIARTEIVPVYTCLPSTYERAAADNS